MSSAQPSKGVRPIKSGSFPALRRDIQHTVRPMKMDRVGKGRMIDESDNSFSAPLHAESRTWGNAIVSHKIGFAKPWIDLLLERFDLYLEISDGTPSAHICVGAGLLSVMCDDESGKRETLFTMSSQSYRSRTSIKSNYLLDIFQASKKIRDRSELL